MIAKEEALPGRQEAMLVTNQHYVNGNPICEPFEDGLSKAMFGLGCFWGAERKFWELDGVYSTAVGYAAGYTPNPDYKEVCSGLTGHNEVVLVIYDEAKITYCDLLKCFWQSHDPTQGMRQGNDIGTQYRSGIYTYTDQQAILARESCDIFQSVINGADNAAKRVPARVITTEIIPAPIFYYAEDYHQQYLAKNVNGYCGLGGLDLSFPDTWGKKYD